MTIIKDSFTVPLERERAYWKEIFYKLFTCFAYSSSLLTLTMFPAPTFSQRSPRIALYGSFTNVNESLKI